MSGLLERARSVFKRKPRDDEDDFDDGFDERDERDLDEQDARDGRNERGPISPVVGPNGIVQSHPQQPHHGQPHHSQPQHHNSRPGQHQNGPRHQQAQTGDGQQPLAQVSATRSGQLEIALHNDTNSSTVFAYIST